MWLSNTNSKSYTCMGVPWHHQVWCSVTLKVKVKVTHNYKRVEFSGSCVLLFFIYLFIYFFIYLFIFFFEITLFANYIQFSCTWYTGMVHLHIFILIQQYCRPVENKNWFWSLNLLYKYNVLPLNHYAGRLCIPVRQRRVVQGTRSV